MYESRGVLSAEEKRGFGEGGIELCAKALMRIRAPKHFLARLGLRQNIAGMRPDEKPACVESLPSIPSLVVFGWLDEFQLWGRLVFPCSAVRTWNTWIFSLTRLRDSGDFLKLS